MSENGFDGGIAVNINGKFLDPDLFGVWYYMNGKALLCKIGATGSWGRADIAGGAGVSILGIDLATIDIAGTLAFYTSPWKFSGSIGGDACIGLYCGQTVCEGYIGEYCPHNPGMIRSASCGKTGSCFTTKLIRAVDVISALFSFEP